MSFNRDEWGGFSSGDEQTTGPAMSHPTSTAIIDMSNVEDSSATSSFEDVGDVNHRMKDTNGSRRQEQQDPSGMMGGISGNLGKVVADQMWQSGQQQAKKMIDVYGNIDILRPYFDIDPKTLLWRCAYSFVPLKNLSTAQKIPSELYGPLMTVFTLIAILLMNMKTSGTVLQQGTLMGTAFGICFGYWFGVSGFMYFLAFLCNAYISIVQCLTLLGYGMISHCVILLFGHFTHYSHGTFYVLWALIAGASAARMITVLLSRTVGKSQRLLLCVAIASLHMLFLLYLHFAYHHVVEEIVHSLEMVDTPIEKHDSEDSMRAVRDATHLKINNSLEIKNNSLNSS
uniref:Protein YIPF3 n=1 Tax=Phallusia mammillata TaxID=59560 RepID=A0A6F9DY81_9ASCI|nr:protein YIPF3-like [Phallusia mammillata]